MRALLSVVLLLGLYVVCAALVVGYLAFVAFAVAHIGDAPSLLVWLMAASLGVGTAAVVRGVVLASGSHPVLPGSRAVSREQAPGLWATVRDVADRFGTDPPVEVRLTAEPNAAVGEDARMLGLRRGTRRLYVGMPLLIGLSPEELRAVLCHEFGHYARGHTRLGAITYRGAAALADARRALAETARGNALVAAYGGLPVLVINGYGRLYDRLSLAVRRRQELAADAAAARIAGAATTAAALRSTLAVAAAWARHRASSTDPLGSFAAALDTDAYRKLLADHRARPREHLAARDSHPGMARRLELLARRTDEPLPWTPRTTLPADPPVLSVPRESSRPVPRRATVSVALSIGLLLVALLSLYRVSHVPAPAPEPTTPAPPPPVLTLEVPPHPPTVPDPRIAESIARLSSELAPIPTR